MGALVIVFPYWHKREPCSMGKKTCSCAKSRGNFRDGTTFGRSFSWSFGNGGSTDDKGCFRFLSHSFTPVHGVMEGGWRGGWYSVWFFALSLWGHRFIAFYRSFWSQRFDCRCPKDIEGFL